MKTLCCLMACFLSLCLLSARARAAELTVDLGRSEGVIAVGAFCRWDADGNPQAPVNPKARIDAPDFTARADRRAGNRWVFRDLRPGRYDLVIFVRDRVRIEGFHYPPVAEFDPPLSGKAGAPEEARNLIGKDIAQARHYENKVTPLYLGGDDRQVRVLVQLVRDQPTSYDAEYGQPVATVRHEVWQYTYKRGTWSKDRKTKVLDRLLMPKSELQRWTWVWEPSLGGIEVLMKPVNVTYQLPRRFDRTTAKGWFPP